jgi:CBS domain containing-hemolysin-like protein
MLTQFMNTFLMFLAVAAGGAIGCFFGIIQVRALRRNEQRQKEEKLSSGWAVMPGSASRVAYLLMVLVGIQVVCPLLFKDGTQWWVSAGVVMGYGYVLYRRLMQRRTGVS